MSERESQLGACLREVRTQGERRVQVFYGAGVVTLQVQRRPPIVESIRVTRIQVHRLVKFRNRLLKVPGSPQGKAIIVVGLVGLGIFCHGALQDGHRLLNLALFEHVNPLL